METVQKLHPIYIVGAGAIGRALAVFLKQDKKNVVLIRGNVDGLETSVERISVGFPDGSKFTQEIDVKTFSVLDTVDGIVVITTKSHANSIIAGKLSLKGTSFPLILLQNGLNVEQPFIEQGFSQIYRCVLFVTSQYAAGNEITYKPVAASPVGLVKGDIAQLKTVVKQLDNAWFAFKFEPDIQTVIWKKVIINCVFNSVCSLLNVDNGIFFRDSRVLEIAKRVIGECIGIAERCNVLLNAEEVLATLLAISRSSDGQLISTLQDINYKRPTEIGTLNLEIARIASALGVDDLVKETRLLGELTALKSAISLIQE